MRIIVVSQAEKHLLELARLLRERSTADEIDVVAGTLARLQETRGAAVLLLHQATLDNADLEQLEVLSSRNPAMAIVLVCQPQPAEFLLRAMRSGVREVLAAPLDPSQLQAAMRRIEDKLSASNRSLGKVLALSLIHI